MIVNIITSYRTIVTVCDKELLGKLFEEGERQLHVKENFYGGKILPEKDVSTLLQQYVREDATFNLIGERTIALALQEGLITSEGVDRVQGVPFSLILV